MVFRALAVIFAFTVFPLLSACQQDIAVEIRTRPAMVTHPVPAADAVATFPGEVRARFEPELAFRIGGKISRRLVDVGQPVKKDQPLAELDPEDVKLQLEAIKSQVTAAEANLQLVKSERDRYKELLGRQVISRSQYENAENLFLAGEARLSQVRAEYSVASNQAGYAVLRATKDGVISNRYAEVGQVVSAGQKVFTLAVRGDREVAINLPENSQGYVSVGQQVMISLWSQPGELYPGAVRELAPAADAMSRTFAARVSFLDPLTPAELGQSARVFFRVEGEIPLSVPLSAVSAEAGDPFVYVVNPVTSMLKRRPVKIGAFGETGVSVLAGLTTEDWVVVAGLQVLSDGQVVRPVDRDNRTIELAGGE